MPGKNKPKRLDRNRAWRVARRKKRISKLLSGGSRVRAPRPKKKKAVEVKPAEKVVKVKKVVGRSADSKTRNAGVKKAVKKTTKKE